MLSVHLVWRVKSAYCCGWPVDRRTEWSKVGPRGPINRDGWGTIRLACVNCGGTPAAALFLSAFVTLGFVLSGSFNRVLAVTSFVLVSKYLLLCLSVFVLRRREPSTSPYRAFGYPYTSAVAVLGSLACLLGSIAADTRNSLYGCLVIIASYPVYRLARRHVLIGDASAVGP